MFICEMNIGIFTYGTRGDLQPYIALGLELQKRGHMVTLSASEDFKAFVESYGLRFTPLWGNAEHMMNSEEGKRMLQTEDSIKLMKYYFKVLHDNRFQLRKSFFEAVTNVDFIIANSMTLPIISTLAEKYNKKMVLTYFMPPMVTTAAFPLGDFDFLDFGWYNKLTYKIAHFFFWKLVKNDTNEYRKELGLQVLNKNLIQHLDDLKTLDLYCISPSLIPQPKDWADHHKITGVINIPKQDRVMHVIDNVDENLINWIKKGEKPIYIGFGSNGLGNPNKIITCIENILHTTNERVLFCTGWAQYNNIPIHANLYTLKSVNHELIFPLCKVGVFHGGAGTLATMLRHKLPMIIISFYTDQPTWGKIIARKKIGIHIPLKKLNSTKLIKAIHDAQANNLKENLEKYGERIALENGLEHTVNEIEYYFNFKKKDYENQ